MSATTATQTAPASSGRTTAPRPRQGPGGNILVAVLAVLSLIWVIPLVFILINSFKGKFYISDAPFSPPTGETFAGLDNYATGLALSGFARAIG